eukprot:CAMPEP_0168463612 /NCGR_PEP_ID=MMETSP0228-20121227/55146_1 /TAXON_ID=133427 /ORGANISM="Protoceratium reticulatum, Strain CCCM 535 (=CCMP 1889)" /LENGTH=110 /DNA_ID=CAMNT_0008479075 /DNA_START=14 /DNA_END=342 /DNA_ORIENTATION=+
MKAAACSAVSPSSSLTLTSLNSGRSRIAMQTSPRPAHAAACNAVWPEASFVFTKDGLFNIKSMQSSLKPLAAASCSGNAHEPAGSPGPSAAVALASVSGASAASPGPEPL